MIISTLNGIAVLLARTPDAAMSIPEQLMIQPPLAAILAKPTVVKRVASNAPYVALIVGFAMWGGRVAQLRQSTQPVPMPTAGFNQPVSDEPSPMESSNGSEPLPDTGPIWDELRTISMD